MQQEKRSIIVYAAKLLESDGASMDAVLQAETLKSLGYQVVLTSSVIAIEHALVKSFDECRPVLSDPSAILMIHFCGYDRFLPQLRSRTKCLTTLRFQNITPCWNFFPRFPKSFIYSCLGYGQLLWFRWKWDFRNSLSSTAFTSNTLQRWLGTIDDYVIPPLSYLPPHRIYCRVWPPQQCIQALFVGRISPSKGIDTLLEVVRLWNSGDRKSLVAVHQRTSDQKSWPRIQLHIVGHSTHEFQSYLKQLKILASKHQLEQDIIFHGNLSDEQLGERYENADLFLFASKHEGFGLPLIEAQHHGLPIIAADQPAVREVVSTAGIIVSKNNVEEEMSRAIAKLLNDKDLVRTFHDEGLKNLQHFSKEQVREKLKEWLGSYGPSQDPS
jgi:glycosyltransferase involved in cell wall biosynthesis